MGWEPGTQIGSYEVIAPLGNGGMGQVYKVRHLISHRAEAMKVVLAGSAGRSEVTERFLREIRVLANLGHPNIAALHTAFRHEDQLIMVMEYVEGMSLSDRMARGVTLEYSLNYMRQVLSALQYAHSQGVIHRDIKPSNIMIGNDGQVKLLDFGLALMSTPDPRLTSSGSLLGSVHYISPEQVRGEAPDARSDLYSFGVAMYELITGRLPIQGNSFPEIISGHLQKSPAPPSSVNPAIPAALSGIVMRLLAKDRSDRFQNAAEVLKALDSVQIDNARDWAVTMETTFIVPSPLPAKGAAASARGADSGRGRYDTAVLDDISAQLARHIGPIAKVVVKRASSSSNNLRELCDKLAQEIDSEKNRKMFMAGIRKHLRPSDL